MADRLYTKNGRPLRLDGNRVFGPNGSEVARIRSGKAYGPDGDYVGTVVRDRLVYRSTDSARRGPVFAPSHRAASARANRAGSAMWGDEPPIHG